MIGRMSFEDFVNWIQNASDTCILPSEHKNQLDWFTDKNGNVLVDHIGKFENLDEEWKIISQKLGICRKLVHKNFNFSYKDLDNKNKDYRKYYSKETKKIIEKKIKKDIEYFGYKF